MNPSLCADRVDWVMGASMLPTPVSAMTDDDVRTHFETLRWPDGVVCPFCQSTVVTRLHGRAHRRGLLLCRQCRHQFTVTVGTMMQGSHLPLRKWLLAFHSAQLKGEALRISDVQDKVGVAFVTAWRTTRLLRRELGLEPLGRGAPGRSRECLKAYEAKPRPKRTPFTNADYLESSIEFIWRRCRRWFERYSDFRMEDAVGDTLAALAVYVTNKPTYYFANSGNNHWHCLVRKVCDQTCLGIIRKSKRTIPSSQLNWHLDYKPGDQSDRLECEPSRDRGTEALAIDRMATREVLSRLPDGMRVLAQAVWRDGYTLAEAETELGLRRGEASRQLTLAKSILQPVLSVGQ